MIITWTTTLRMHYAIAEYKREFDHVPRLTVVNQTLIELTLVQWRESHDVTLVEPDRSVGCSGIKMATKGMKFCLSMR